MNRDKFIMVMLFVFGVFIIYQSAYLYDNNKASMWFNNEKEFSEPVDIVWRGEIISTMAGGSCVGLRGKFNNYSQAVACLSDGHSGELWKYEGAVTVIGKWLGITCAYRNTIFGECVPDIRIEDIR